MEFLKLFKKQENLAFEKVNMYHPDKVADRIAGAMVDLAYANQENPKVAVEVLIGHGKCTIITESSYKFNNVDIINIVHRISETTDIVINLYQNEQDIELSKNQEGNIRCGDNGIFKGVKPTRSELFLTRLTQELANEYKSDGKYIINNKTIIACQSKADEKILEKEINLYGYKSICNPLGYWTGGINVDSGATNRKLGSDMGRGVTGGGLHGKDLSKADVSVNIYCYLEAVRTGKEVNAVCAIGDEYVKVNGKKIAYSTIVNEARHYIFNVLGGFEKFAEYGLLRV